MYLLPLLFFQVLNKCLRETCYMHVYTFVVYTYRSAVGTRSLTSLSISITALLAFPSCGGADTHSSTDSSVTAATPSRTLLAPGRMWQRSCRISGEEALDFWIRVMALRVAMFSISSITVIVGTLYCTYACVLCTLQVSYMYASTLVLNVRFKGSMRYDVTINCDKKMISYRQALGTYVTLY